MWSTDVLHPAARPVVLQPGGSVRGLTLVCPAERLRSADAARWVRRHGNTVAAYCGDELALAISSGVKPARLVAYGDRGQWGPIRCAMSAGVRLFVVDAPEQIPVLAHCVSGRQQVLLDLRIGQLDDAIEAICESDRLDLVGMHCQLVGRSIAVHGWAAAVRTAVARMARVRAEQHVMTTRVSLSGPVPYSLSGLAAVLEESMEDACARWHFPRPGLSLTPREVVTS